MRKLIRCVSSVITHRAKWALRLPMNVRREGRKLFWFTGPVQMQTHHSRIRRIDAESAAGMAEEAQRHFSGRPMREFFVRR